MRTLVMILGVVLANDVVLLLALDVTVPAWLVVVGGALALTAALYAAVSASVEADDRPSRTELQREIGVLRERVNELES